MHVQTVLRIIAEGRGGKRLKGYYHLVYKYAQLYGIANNPDVICPWFLLAVTVSLAHNYNQGAVSDLMDLYREECREYVNRYFHLLAGVGSNIEQSEESVGGFEADMGGPSGDGGGGATDYDRGSVAVVRSGDIVSGGGGHNATLTDIW